MVQGGTRAAGSFRRYVGSAGLVETLCMWLSGGVSHVCQKEGLLGGPTETVRMARTRQPLQWAFRCKLSICRILRLLRPRFTVLSQQFAIFKQLLFSKYIGLFT